MHTQNVTLTVNGIFLVPDAADGVRVKDLGVAGLGLRMGIGLGVWVQGLEGHEGFWVEVPALNPKPIPRPSLLHLVRAVSPVIIPIISRYIIPDIGLLDGV